MLHAVNKTLQDHTVVYGGSFDPPHLCHQMSCLYLLEALGAAHVWVVPLFEHAFGKVLVDFATRFAMCQLMVQPFAERASVLDLEARRGGPSRTFDTLCELRAAHPDRPLALAVGADLLPDTPRWHRWADVEAMVPVVVIGRSGYSHPDAPLALPAIASSHIRSRLRRGESARGLVPLPVAEFIESRGLYR